MWQEKQRKQLNQLQTLLRKASSLDDGSGVIEKMRVIQTIANEILFGIPKSGEIPFFLFLEKEATKGHEE
jgi:hypothetical protein